MRFSRLFEESVLLTMLQQVRLSATKQKVIAPTSATPLIAGATYRLNITVASGSFDIWAALN